jgi:hypothetical protein
MEIGKLFSTIKLFMNFLLGNMGRGRGLVLEQIPELLGQHCHVDIIPTLCPSSVLHVMIC